MAHDVSQTVTMEMEAVFTAWTFKSDNGMTGVHFQQFDEIESVGFQTVHMFGRDWTRAQLVEHFGEQGATALIRLLEDSLEDDMLAWEEA